MAEGEKPPIDGRACIIHSHSVDYRTQDGPVLVQFSMTELYPNFPRPKQNPEIFHAIFPSVEAAIHHFEALVNHLKEFDP